MKAAKAKAKEADGVFLVEKEKAVFKAVKTGIMGDTDIEVLEGVTEGAGDRDRLLQDPAHPARPGQDQARGQGQEEGALVSAPVPVAAPGDGAMIVAEDLWRTYVMGAEEIHALRGVSFRVRARRVRGDHGSLRARASRRS